MKEKYAKGPLHGNGAALCFRNSDQFWIYGRGVQPVSTGVPAGMTFGSASIFAVPGFRVFAALPTGTGPDSPTRVTPTPDGAYGRLLPSSSVGFVGAGG